jgi:hypothetical protein
LKIADPDAIGEERFVTLAADPTGRILITVYSYSGTNRRIISAREAGVQKWVSIMDPELARKKVIASAATRGVARAIATRLLLEGCTVSLYDRRARRSVSTARSMGRFVE